MARNSMQKLTKYKTNQ